MNEKWIDEATGLNCCMKENSGHLCGYVGVDKEHPLFRKEYRERLPIPASFSERDVSRVGPMDLLIHSVGEEDGLCDMAIYFDVHQGITFSNFWEGEEIWFFGFDCAHAGDEREVCNEDYVRKECAGLAKQLFDFKKEDL